MRNDLVREAVCFGVVKALRAERLRQKLSMERLAEHAGLSQGMISLVERDLRNPTLDTLLRIADVLKVDLGAVLQQAAAEAKSSAGGRKRAP